MKATYTTELKDREDLYQLYQRLDWNDALKLDKDQLARAMAQSWFVVYAYDGNRLVGTGRVISDGVTNAYLCGIGVDPAYQGTGIGKAITGKLVAHCQQQSLHMQLFCEDHLVSYYHQLGFQVFAVGMRFSDQ